VPSHLTRRARRLSVSPDSSNAISRLRVFLTGAA
jgi:hypothetical protein